MAAPVIEAGAAYSAVSAGSINTTVPAVVDADDIIVIVAQATNTSGTVAAALTWPAGFTEIFALNNLSASSVPRGLIGAAWKRADGTEDGATLNVTHNGATGAATHFGARTFRVIGCKTTGDPFTQAVTNNPANTNTIDFPAITTSGTEKSLLTMHVNSDNNATIASLTDWTIVGTNGANGTGSDGSNSAFKRENLSAGTYDPTSPTVANTNATGWVTFQIEFEPAAGGPVEHALAGDIALSVALDGAAVRETFLAGDITVPLALDGAATRDTFLAGDIELPLALDGNIAIEILAHALAGEIALDLALDGSILRTTSLAGDIALPLALDGVVARTTFLSGDIALPILLDGAVARTTFLVGDIALPLLLDGAVEVAGVISLAGEMALEIVVDGAVTRTTTLAGDIVFVPALDGALTRGTFLSGDIQLPILLDGDIVIPGAVVAGTVAVIDLATGAAVAIVDLGGDASVSVQDVSSGAASVTVIDLTP